jgi:hypothetical protein
MYLAAQPQQLIVLLHKKTLVPPLKQLTARAMPPIKINRAANQQRMHRAAQICPVHLCDHMKMVAHQN